ncbi:hypothetical protein DFH06DRAFT_88516 [Mycena polygramma]|nr:hypothetical protein DFH06DRAFT_88516 [Mycena polygramma]
MFFSSSVIFLPIIAVSYIEEALSCRPVYAGAASDRPARIWEPREKLLVSREKLLVSPKRTSTDEMGTAYAAPEALRTVSKSLKSTLSSVHQSSYLSILSAGVEGSGELVHPGRSTKTVTELSALLLESPIPRDAGLEVLGLCPTTGSSPRPRPPVESSLPVAL